MYTGLRFFAVFESGSDLIWLYLLQAVVRSFRPFYWNILLTGTTGHNNLNYFQSKIYPEDVSELCRFCEEEPETFAHLLNECPCFQQARIDILHNQPIINSLNWDSDDIIAFSHIPAIDEALTFE